ncbi:MAG: porin [Bacteroidota bacterium]|jgi:Phosphate-selective porin O and P
MKKFTRIILMSGFVLPFLFLSLTMKAQMSNQHDVDTLKQKVMTINDKVAGVEERLATAEGDLAKLTKIKLSGYIQSQWINYEASNVFPNNYFMVRRARIKFTYEPIDGIVFVLQPDFQPGNITIKDAYAQANDPWLKMFSLWVGKFNRPNYEVEYSSSNREVAERSRVIRAIYPDERAIGAKLEIHPPKLPLKFQLAIFNGNDGIATVNADGSTTILQNTDYDNYKDLMARLTYTFKLGNFGGLTIGAHGYYGAIKANNTTVLGSDYTVKSTLSNLGKSAPKQWGGFEAQLSMDVLGGLIIKGEYIMGVNSTPGATFTGSSVATANLIKNDTLFMTTTTTKTTTSTPSISKNFSGWYVYLIKNIGKRNQISVRYDWYNPNTKLSADQIGTAKYDVSSTTPDPKPVTTYANGTPTIATVTKTTNVLASKLVSGVSDIPYGTWDIAYTYYFTDNIKFMIDYDIVLNKKVGTVNSTTGNGNVTSSYTVNGVASTYDYSKLIHQNVLTLRLQVKF